MTTPDENEHLPSREAALADASRVPKMVLWTMVAYAGIGLAVLPALYPQEELLYVLRRAALPVLGTTIALIGSAFLWAELRKRSRHASDRFVDVDERNRKELLSELAVAREAIRRTAAPDDLPIQAKDSRPAGGDIGIHIQENVRDHTFSGYFTSIREVLERKAAVADEKASILLDKGVAYSRFGIFVFVLSIVLWQFLAWKDGFKVQHIYGIASCSVLFVFIEFLSAWFLKQYRHFVDTSTYLIKVKSIFDRYMLSYHAASEFDMLDAEERASSQMGAVLDLLRDDIKWPDDYLLKNADVSFARETLQSMADILKASRKSNSKE